MVLPLRPSRFYGSSLPRPRFYSDLKFNSERVDPPMGVTAPLLSWAKDAHWSMGGLSYEKKRMAGKIEGSKKRLRDELENGTSKQIRGAKKRKLLEEEAEKDSNGVKPHEDFETPKSKVISSPKSRVLSSPKSKIISSPKSRVLSSPKSKSFSSPKSKAFSSPRAAQIFKPKWATDQDNEDYPLVVPASIKRHPKKRSPKVRIRGRDLVDSSEADSKGALFTKSVSSIVGQKRSRAQSVVQCALKRQATGITQVYDYVPMPDKILQVSGKRVSPRSKKENKEGVDSGAPAGFEPRSPQSAERCIRRSSRVLSYSPGPLSYSPGPFSSGRELLPLLQLMTGCCEIKGLN